MSTLKSYQERFIILESKCRWCNMDMSRAKIRYYNHPGGYLVDEMIEKQWLYIECPNCQYEWSFKKLGIK